MESAVSSAHTRIESSLRLLGRITAAVLLVVCASSLAAADPYRLLWDANVDGVTAGYVVYYGTAPDTYQPAEGVDVGNVTEFQVNLTPGTTYFFRVRAYNAAQELGPPSEELSFTVTSLSSNSPVAPGATINVNFTHGPGAVGDWVSLAPAGPAISEYIDWRYLNNTYTRPASPITSGALTFTAPSVAGSYVLRFFANDSFNLVASAALTVVPLTTVASIPATVPPNGGVTASVASAPGNTADWVAMYANGAANGAYLDWFYLNGLKTPPGAGVTSANVNFTAPGTPGAYQFRVFANGSFTLLAQTGFTVSGTAPQVGRELPSVAPGANVAAMVSNGPANANDWIALAPVGSGFGGYVDWRYLNSQQSPPGAGLASANVAFTMPNTPGNYEFRFYANNSSTLLATSPSFTISATAPNITAAPLLVGPGGGIQLNVTNGPGNPGDWVALHATGTSFPNYERYQYLNGLPTPPASGVTSAVLSFVTPTTPGTYQFILYSNDSSNILARSQTFTVAAGAPNIVPELVTVAPSAPVSFAVSNGPGDPTDWLALYAQGAAQSAFLDWRYLNGTQSPTTGLTGANVQITMPATPGIYELAFYRANSYELLARSVTLNVSNSARSITPAATTVSAGSALNVTVANGPANAADWIALYPMGAGGSAFVDWKYLNGSQTPPGNGVAGATVSFTMPNTPGVYQFVFYSDNSLQILARGAAVTVQ